MKTKCLVVMTTVDSGKEAGSLAEIMVRKKLAACGQVVGPMKSVYQWKGKIVKAREWIVIYKTLSTNYKKFEKALLSIHPYDVPEIFAVPIVKGSRDYLKWIKDSTK